MSPTGVVRPDHGQAPAKIQVAGELLSLAIVALRCLRDFRVAPGWFVLSSMRRFRLAKPALFSGEKVPAKLFEAVPCLGAEDRSK
jgi:hypothetical protein